MAAARSPPTVPAPPALPPPLTSACALFLDVDGTLLDIAPTPAAVHVDAAILELLPQLAVALDGAVALITGRGVTDVDRLFPGLALPIAGQHGCERRDADGTLHLHAPARGTMAKLRTLLEAFAARHPGILLEDKGVTLAVHYRLAPALADEVRRAVETSVARVQAQGLVLQAGKQLVEVRPDQRDKGTAIRDFMRERPFAGRTPVFVGDDVTDEDGFAEVQRMPGGVAIKVGDGRTCARHRLGSVSDVRQWLSRLVAGLPVPAPQDEPAPRGAG